MIWRAIILSFAVMLSACTPQQQLFHTDPLHSPSLEKTTFHTSDDVSLPVRIYIPQQKPKAVIVALHGFNDYSNAFAGAGEFFKRERIALYAYDQRGFGAAADAGIWGNSANLTRDLAQFTALVQQKHPGTPLYILAESMGGAVALATTDLPDVDGIILVAPAVWGGDAFHPLLRGILWAMAHTVPDYRMTGSDLKILATDNLPLLRQMSLDPLIIKATRVDAVYGLVDVMDQAYANVPQINIPVLLLYGGNDQVIPRRSIEIALARFSQPIQFAFYPEGYHMLLRDLEGELVLRDITSWIKDPARPLPSGFSREIQPPKN